MDRPPKNVFIFAGEPSGDLHGSRLARILKNKSPEILIEGVAGPKMREESVRGPLIMEDFEVMGLTDVIRALPKLYSHFFT
ncbi:MAG TPA: lipid-A-disaccharide synthase, partial [Parachlamydiaceae bacterium]|nr:lipid-A-disaccharide synthase [Parachlamydiaceae bacterium]